MAQIRFDNPPESIIAQTYIYMSGAAAYTGLNSRRLFTASEPMMQKNTKKSKTSILSWCT